MSTTESDEYADIRDAVAKLCAQFPGEYWRELDEREEAGREGPWWGSEPASSH